MWDSDIDNAMQFDSAPEALGAYRMCDNLDEDYWYAELEDMVA